MKRINLIGAIAIGMMAIVMVGASLLPSSARTMSSGVIVIIRQKPTTSGNAPRTSEYNPFYAELTDFGLLLAADSDWGEATVTLSSFEGDYYQTSFDMADGSILLPVNGTVGDSYILSIVIGGLEFEGEFLL